MPRQQVQSRGYEEQNYTTLRTVPTVENLVFFKREKKKKSLLRSERGVQEKDE
jgi:hypothetical protein